MGVGIRKMQADITQSDRSQQGVTNRMHQDIGVRMPQQPFVKGNERTAEDQLAPGHQAMDIVSYSDLHWANIPCNFRGLFSIWFTFYITDEVRRKVRDGCRQGTVICACYRLNSENL